MQGINETGLVKKPCQPKAKMSSLLHLLVVQ